MPTKATDPYCGFKDDNLRLKALVNRERWRYGCWAVASAFGGLAGILSSPTAQQMITVWLSK